MIRRNPKKDVSATIHMPQAIKAQLSGLAEELRPDINWKHVHQFRTKTE